MTTARAKEAGWLTRERGLAIAFVAICGVIAWFGWMVIQPMVGPLTWALALAVLAMPLYRWLARKLTRKTLAAALTTLAVAAAISVPAGFAAREVAKEATGAAAKVQKAVKDKSWREFVDRYPSFKAINNLLSSVVDPQEQLDKLSEHLPTALFKTVSGSLGLAAGVAIAHLLLFFFLRDRDRMLDGVRRMLPLSDEESRGVFKCVADTILAVIYGTLAVALVQGALGGLMFWWLDLPAPILWGCAMAALAIVPVIGTALIWGPAALFLLMEGDAGKALVLVAWGGIVIGLVDNLIQPFVVKDRMHMHFVPVFLSMLGGLAAFGASGLILGPVLLSVAVAFINIARHRAGSEPV
jgi:predicted PurR-regulated permease PerM